MFSSPGAALIENNRRSRTAAAPSCSTSFEANNDLENSSGQRNPQPRSNTLNALQPLGKSRTSPFKIRADPQVPATSTTGFSVYQDDTAEDMKTPAAPSVAGFAIFSENDSKELPTSATNDVGGFAIYQEDDGIPQTASATNDVGGFAIYQETADDGEDSGSARPFGRSATQLARAPQSANDDYSTDASSEATGEEEGNGDTADIALLGDVMRAMNVTKPPPRRKSDNFELVMDEDFADLRAQQKGILLKEDDGFGDISQIAPDE